ncbi:MAG TPA: FAD-binding oxidoreductase [Rugosimonospora sp.]|nr:FAD-binding oxidoreductase [Rugosimonospora sp.]
MSAVDLAVGGPARDAGPADTVGGVQPRFVAAPRDAASLGEVLARCAGAGLVAVPRGDGTKLDWGHPPSTVDVVVDTGRLAGVREHSAADLVATIGAGTPVRAVQAVLARSGQRLALDPPSTEGTIGGMLATGEAGPLRHTYGAPRDLLLGVEFARADGVVAHAGGKVVKNVAGYDLGKLLCGSYGTLGVLASATFRLHPLPARRSWVVRGVHNPSEVAGLVAELLASPLAPTAVEVDLPSLPVLPRQRDGGPVPGGQLAVLFEGSVAGVPARCRAAGALLGGDVSTVDEAPAWWGRYPFGAGDVALRLAVPVDGLHAALYALRDVAGIAFPVRGSAGVGVVYAALPASLPAERLGSILDAVRTTLIARSGNCVVLSAPAPLSRQLDLWGPAPGLGLMRRVKEQFDPLRLLSPGRFVGGI